MKRPEMAEGLRAAYQARWVAAMACFPALTTARAFAAWDAGHRMPTPAEMASRASQIVKDAREEIFRRALDQRRRDLGRALTPAEVGAMAREICQ